jgi:hypothetical protein
MKLAFIDTEFHNTQEEFVKPVCASIILNNADKTNWNVDTTTEAGRRHCADVIRWCNGDGYVFVGFQFEAEARFMQAIGYDPLRNGIKCIDLYILYRLLANRWDEVQYGKHLITSKETHTSKVKFLKKPPPKWAQSEDDEDEEEEGDDSEFSGAKMNYGLASATYKFTGQIRDTEDKDECRKRIIAGGPFTVGEMDWIRDYCYDDTKHLPELYDAMMMTYKGFLGSDASIEKLIGLSKYSIHTAEMVRIGYPVQLEWLQKVTDAVPLLIKDLQRDFIKKCNTLNLPFVPLKYDRKEDCFKENQKLIQEYLLSLHPHAVLSEKTKRTSLKEENLDKLRTPKHLEPGLVDFFYRYRMDKKTLASFKRSGTKRYIWDYIGSDGRCRPYFGTFVAQTSRSQPSANSYIFLKSAALRFLVHPKPGKAVFGIDYKSQEFIIGAILSGDEVMKEAYYSGDAYIFLAKNIGMVPDNATKKSHPKEREAAKGTELSLGYGMGIPGIARRIRISEEEAGEIVRGREKLYAEFSKFRRWMTSDYKKGNPIVLPDGWAHGPDNENLLSVGNVRGQGHGAVVMREAVSLSHAAELSVILTLHDALYFECDLDKLEESIEAADACLKQAFINVLGDRIFTEIHAWGFPCEGRIEKKTPNGTEYTCEEIFWEQGKVSEEERDKWLRFCADDSVNLF